jgi:hypothetical protein
LTEKPERADWDRNRGEKKGETPDNYSGHPGRRSCQERSGTDVQLGWSPGTTVSAARCRDLARQGWSRPGRKNARPLSIVDGSHHSWTRTTRGELHPRGPLGGGRHPGTLRCWFRSRGPAPKESLGGVPSSLTFQASGAAFGDEWGARAFESRPLHCCVHAGSRVTRPVRGASTGAPRGSGHGHARLIAGRSRWPTRNESRAVAVRVRSWCSRGAPRIPSWLQKPSSSIWPREATSVAAGVGDGGLAIAGRLASANDVDRFGCRRRSRDRSVRGEPRDGGRRLGPWQPSSFTGRRGKRSRPSDARR